MNLVGLSASPSVRSRSASLLAIAADRVDAHVHRRTLLSLRELPADALIGAHTDDPRIQAALAAVAEADLVLISTPIYKAAYCGLLKVFLDLLPVDGLRGKTVLPLATGGSPAHLLAIDYALKPVLSALGARHVLDAVFAVDTQLVAQDGGGHLADAAVLARLDRAIEGLGADFPELKVAA